MQTMKPPVSTHQTPFVSVIVPARNCAKVLARSLGAIFASTHSPFECIVVDDGSTDDTPAVGRRFPVRLVSIPDGPRGPAYGRNRGAEAAQGDVLFFIDADVVVTPATLAQAAETFARHPQIAAVFGSYDDAPEADDFLSRYKNLSHHFVHQQARPGAATFWSGCGAVRRDVFIALGGFDEERYSRPSIEDIDLGYRLKAAGHEIFLNRAMQVKHLKRWTLRELIRTDILDRGIPWTQLILQRKVLPNDLNLHVSQRISALLLCFILIYLGLVAFLRQNILMLPLLAGLFLLVAGNWSDASPHFQMSGRAKRLAYGLIAVIAALAVYSRLWNLLVPLGMLVVAMLVDRFLTGASQWRAQVFFGTIVLGATFALVMLGSRFYLRWVVPLLIFTVLIMLVNYRFYVFFARKRGFMFALAVLPFHLLYYLYSVGAFVLGVFVYLRSLRRIPMTAGPKRWVEANPIESLPRPDAAVPVGHGSVPAAPTGP